MSKKLWFVVFLIILIIGAVVAFSFYQRIFGNELKVQGNESYFFVYPQMGINDISDSLMQLGFLKDAKDFS